MTEWQHKTAANLRSQLSVMGQRSMTGRDGFDDELDSLRALDYKVRCTRDEFYTASLGSNVSKNRFRDVMPNEGTRVVLDPVNERGDGDYINANYVDARRLFGVPFVYIAAQAPLRNTVFDFWRMIFENNSVFIVMLCNEVEAGKPKSERYWPDSVGDAISLGPLTIELLVENVRNDTILRKVSLRTGSGKERIVHHLQYLRWPDQGIPQNSAGLMQIVHQLGRSQLSTQTPIVVHCSGGIGRTGVFMTLHIALALFQLEQAISVPRIVQFLKYCRTGMVQRKDQYLFSYYAILREMEHMLWEADQTNNIESRMLRSSANPNASRRGVSFAQGGSAAAAARGGGFGEYQPSKRPAENHAHNAAQQAPHLVRSSLRAEEDDGAAMASGGEPTMGGFRSNSTTLGAFRYSSPSASPPRTFLSNLGGGSIRGGGGYAAAGSGIIARDSGLPPRTMSQPQHHGHAAHQWAASGRGDPNDLSAALEDLKMSNQQRRQTPSRFAAAPSVPRGGNGATKPVPFAEPLSTSIAASPSGLSPLPRQSEARSEVGMRPTGDGGYSGGRGGVGDDVTPEPHYRYSTQPVTPSEGALSPARGGGGRYAAEEEHAMPSRPLPLSSPGRSHHGGGGRAGSPTGTTATAADAAGDAGGRYSGAPEGSYGGAGDRQSSPSGGGGRDVADEIGNFDQSLFGVRRADPNLL